MARAISSLAISPVQRLASAPVASSASAWLAPRNATPHWVGSAGTSGHSTPAGEHIARRRPHPLHLQIEELGGVQAKDVALCRLAEEGNGGDGTGRIEIPMRPVRRKQQLCLRVH